MFILVWGKSITWEKFTEQLSLQKNFKKKKKKNFVPSTASNRQKGVYCRQYSRKKKYSHYRERNKKVSHNCNGRDVSEGKHIAHYSWIKIIKICTKYISTKLLISWTKSKWTRNNWYLFSNQKVPNSKYW